MPGSSVAVTALCPVWLPWVLPGLPRLRTGWNCSIPLFFQWGRRAGQLGGISSTQPPSARLGFHKSQTLSAPSTCGAPLEIWAPPELGWELGPPGNSGPGATWLQHVCLLAGGQAEQLALLSSALCPPPWNCLFPRAEGPQPCRVTARSYTLARPVHSHGT